ncbi:hypothetical protein MTR67_009648 [Solanum verrucosum]|uniref:Uncharacterized protein n=1 Tax=Solanum verrucosum TaxID=315347 RepID=A0AAF0Q4J3_SOLVR|nr:hypothetical protein MTR67_009648 [Solanum verrucosum]
MIRLVVIEAEETPATRGLLRVISGHCVILWPQKYKLIMCRVSAAIVVFDCLYRRQHMLETFCTWILRKN